MWTNKTSNPKRALSNLLERDRLFEGAPRLPEQPEGIGAPPMPTYVSEFLATIDGLALTKAFMEIKDPSLRRRIVALVEAIAGDELN